MLTLIGAHYSDTWIPNCPVPLHRSFEEVCLRFLARRETPEGIRRGSVCLRELVPSRSIAAVARAVFNEPFSAAPMSHGGRYESDSGGSVFYQWEHGEEKYRLSATVSGSCTAPKRGSFAEFLGKRPWFFNRQPNGSTLEYRMEHPLWDVWTCEDHFLELPKNALLFGAQLTAMLRTTPLATFVSAGSEISVYTGTQVAPAG